MDTMRQLKEELKMTETGRVFLEDSESLKHIDSLAKNETDFIIKALEENSSLRKQVNMWQSEHAKRVLELGRMHENIKKAREEIEDINEVVHDGQNHYYKDCADTKKEVLEILDKLIESEDKDDNMGRC